jgi:hypothetical protein
VTKSRTLWLFSDTWIGRIRDGKRKDVVMVNNTIGVQDGTAVTFHHATTQGKPASLFTPPDAKGWFWLFAGHLNGDKLHVFLPRFEKTNQPGAFGFKSVDLWLGTVSNIRDEPTQWKPQYTRVPWAEYSDTSTRTFGSAVLQDGEYVYIYGFSETPAKPFARRRLLTARAPLGKLDDFTAWRFLANGGWVEDAKAATSQCDAIGTEFSISHLPALGRYALVYSENGLSQRILGRFASSPAGPWSAAVLLHTCPEMKVDKRVFTYAAKAHPHLAGERELVISYVVNAFELGPVLNDATLYWPRFVRVVLK